MITNFYKKRFDNLKTILVGLLVFLIINPTFTQAETVVTNSVNISANSSGGQSHASVQTIINGEVVENWSTTSSEAIYYSSNFQTSTTSTQHSTTTQRELTNEQLKTLIKRLEVLISLYVSLLK
ncbi:hypothetical protein KC926_02175 [Candidatus Kaiserbacteria bacterium]|nr:hypothetical protein [Candidatus Kaiserbacteria bacterium]